MSELPANLDAAYAHLPELSDPVQRALASKAIMQSNVLGYPDGASAFEGVTPTNLGIFRVLPTEAMIDWASPSGALELKAGQIYLDYHMPKSDDISKSAANDGYAQIADYLQAQPQISHIIGVTYRIMALSAQRNQGFHTEEIPLPGLVMNYASAFWQNMMPEAKARQFQTAHIVWQDRQTFIDRFGAVG